MRRVTGSPWIADFRSWTWPQGLRWRSPSLTERIAASGNEIAHCSMRPDVQNSVISFVISKWMLPERSFSDRWSRGTKLWERDCHQILREPSVSLTTWPKETEALGTRGTGKKSLIAVYLYRSNLPVALTGKLNPASKTTTTVLKTSDGCRRKAWTVYAVCPLYVVRLHYTVLGKSESIRC